MRLSEIDVATAPRNMTPGEISAAARGVDHRIAVDTKMKAAIDKKAQTYIKPLMRKWQEALAAQANVGKNIDDVTTQRMILAGIISRYAGISPDDVDVLEKKILRSDLTDGQQVSDILRTAVVMTLYQRMAAPRRSTKSVDDQPDETTPREGALVTDNGVTYYFHDGRWYGQKDDLPVKIPQLSDELTKQAITMGRRGKLTLRR